jgi:hypothetical protein
LTLLDFCDFCLISCVAKGENLVRTCLDFAWFLLWYWLRNIAMVVSCYLIVVPGHLICCLVIVLYCILIVVTTVTCHIFPRAAHLLSKIDARFFAFGGVTYLRICATKQLRIGCNMFDLSCISNRCIGIFCQCISYAICLRLIRR